MPQTSTFLPPCLLLAAATLLIAQTPPAKPTSLPPFTIGKDTTLVDGPLNEDGTINYVAAMNKLIGEGLKNENNAALQMLDVRTISSNDKKDAAVFAELHAPAPRERIPIELLKKPNNFNTMSADEQQFFFNTQDNCTRQPWKAADHPDIANWLKVGEPALAVIEKAAQLPRYYLPFVSDKSPPTAISGFPNIVGPHIPARDMFMSRAMLRSGEGDLAGALADLRTLRKVARLLDQEPLFLFHQFAMAMESKVLRSYGIIAVTILPTKAGFDLIHAEISAFAPIPEWNPKATEEETMCNLDELMRCIRGDFQPVLQMHAWVAGEDDKNLAPGDFSKVDWDLVLKEAIRLDRIPFPPQTKPYAERIKEIDETDQTTPDPLADFNFDPKRPADEQASERRQLVEKFLRIRPAESPEDYSRRISAWLAAWDKSTRTAVLYPAEQCRLLREMALLSITLAEYHTVHAAYPDTLQALAQPVLQDPFSGKDILYHADKNSFILWSVGRTAKTMTRKPMTLSFDPPPETISPGIAIPGLSRAHKRLSRSLLGYLPRF